MKVFIVVAKSESGDEKVAVYQTKPTRDQKRALCFEVDPTEDGPGDFDSYVFLDDPREVEVR